MSSEKMQELHEHAQHARHDPLMVPVSLTMAILAAVVAMASLLGHRAHTEEILIQDQVTNKWSYFQAKNIRLHIDETLVDLAEFATSRDARQSTSFIGKYHAEAIRYDQEKKEIEAAAKKLEGEGGLVSRQADRYDMGEVFLEVALIVSSITLLSGRKMFWYGGVVIGIIGAGVALSGFLQILI